MDNQPFTVAQKRPIRPEMTVSRPAGLGKSTSVSWFSLGAGTSITAESYDSPVIYVGAEGCAEFLLGREGRAVALGADEALFVPPGTLCGVQSAQGVIYTEVIPEKELIMNNIVKSGEAFALKDLISYEEGSIANLDVAHTDNMKFVLMAFDEGTGLTPHRAPGNAILTALEGKAIIGYEGKDYELNAGESFRFDKNGLHSVTAQGKFKMSLLLVLE